MILTQEQLSGIENITNKIFTLFICEICQGRFYTSKASTIYCGPACSSTAYRARLKEKSRQLQLKIDEVSNLTIASEIALVENVTNEQKENKSQRKLIDVIYNRKK